MKYGSGWRGSPRWRSGREKIVEGREEMAEKGWRQWIRDRGLEKWFRRDNFIVLALVGILLFVVALPVRKDGGGEGREETAAPREPQGAAESGTGGREPVSGEDSLEEEYAVWLEQRLTETLSGIAGVGKVKVMITLKTSRELVVEKDHTVRRSTTGEGDSQGGSRSVSDVNSSESTVYSTEGSVSRPYVTKTDAPRIEGILVVAQGAGSGTVNRTIVEIMGALFGVEAHKVMVVKME